MKRIPAPVELPTGPKVSSGLRQAHPLLSAFPLAVMMLGTLLVLFALTMTLNADNDAAARLSTSTSHVAGSPATSHVATRVSSGLHG